MATICPISDYLHALHLRYAECAEGALADYIPELTKADPRWFGICLVTTDGYVYQVGDTHQAFTIQSISKPFTYGVALEDQGRDAVLKKVGVEPTGDAFNSISLDPNSGKPANAMINAGAIATTAMVDGKTAKEKLRRILYAFSNYVGHPLTIDEAVYRSEKRTGHRNRAIAHLLRNFDIIGDDPEESLDAYFQQCSISVTCADLGVMAATLANGGLNPITGTRAVVADYVPNILSVMGSCGMYDYAGEWIYNVGMPAKSGVAGGIVAVLPGKLGIGLFSPLLDERGNSVRSIKACHELATHLDLHMFSVSRSKAPVMRLKFNAAQVTSKKRRDTPEARALRDSGESVTVYQLQGELDFAASEALIRDILASFDGMQYVIIDCKRVMSADRISAELFCELHKRFSRARKRLIFADIERLRLLGTIMRRRLGSELYEHIIGFEDSDMALQWCEDQYLSGVVGSVRAAADGVVALDQFQLFQGLDREQVATLGRMLVLMNFSSGETIIEIGDEAKWLFFLAEGEVSVNIRSTSGKERRVATVSPGMAFGELAILDRQPRSAIVRAVSASRCYALSVEHYDALGDAHPQIKLTLLENLARSYSMNLRRANLELSVLG